MTRKDYIQIAGALKRTMDFACYDHSRHCLVCWEVAEAISPSNAAFKRDGFLIACGLTVDDIENL